MNMVESIARELTRRGWRLATAESCTGGMLSARLTARPGSSAYYAGGVVAYANDLKRRLLNVPPGELARHGAVSAPVARLMAGGALRRCAADVALSTTGIAGPDGATPGKPVGTVYIGIATREVCRAQRFHFAGQRAAVRRQACLAALRILRQTLTNGR